MLQRNSDYRAQNNAGHIFRVRQYQRANSAVKQIRFLGTKNACNILQHQVEWAVRRRSPQFQPALLVIQLAGDLPVAKYAWKNASRCLALTPLLDFHRARSRVRVVCQDSENIEHGGSLNVDVHSAHNQRTSCHSHPYGRCATRWRVEHHRRRWSQIPGKTPKGMTHNTWPHAKGIATRSKDPIRGSWPYY